MSDREMVLDLVQKLPENTPLADIARRIELVSGIRLAIEQTDRG